MIYFVIEGSVYLCVISIIYCNIYIYNILVDNVIVIV